MKNDMTDMQSTLEARARAYRQILQEEGYRAREPEWDAEAKTWDIHVKYEGATLLVVLDLDDPEFVRILMPNFFAVEAATLGASMLALDLTNRKCKCAKVHLNTKRSDTIAAVEFLEPGDAGRSAVLLRYLSMVVNAARFHVHSVERQLESN